MDQIDDNLINYSALFFPKGVMTMQLYVKWNFIILI